MFITGHTYSKWDIYDILGVPKSQQRGAWDTGYRKYKDSYYIFANIGIPGRTGHDYLNFWDGQYFNWQGKNKSNISQPSIAGMLNPSSHKNIYLFTRQDNRDSFIYEGRLKAVNFFDASPVKIVWELLAEHSVDNEVGSLLKEGYSYKSLVTKYERNPLARRLCLKFHGSRCKACNIDLFERYGEIAKNFIHVHHIIPLSEIKEKYILDPIKDLVPLCPNCHNVIHLKSPPLSLEELKSIIKP